VDYDQLPLSFEVLAAPEPMPGHSLSFVEVAVDDYAVRIEYEIVPAVAVRVPGLGWSGCGRDDLGNEYEDVGGAYGQSADGERTEGTLSMPLPVPDAKVLDVRLQLDEGGPVYELRVSLEL
jgi:hypothetical protein